ncbi:MULTISPECIES: hypothetical protein [Mycobacteriaceae]|uniref:Uncharacterized protein n=1 Tax=Mycolicibacterium neoaurum VKM Ac-1815D TaxID=700508 RepID=V5XJ63_MYCNE|nr:MULTISPECIES: hypothetical protein [Mycobacteriaceae]AHC27816.1 hypothetical protein D174_04185 [Mycolicibacterium neoaurum VKM Ac-1815D]AMO04506.1 hypothetical protein MyAD_04100 [Mycolicibacterium neoaurum]AXK77206.1 hypothetical protein DXK33_21025 [Mycolicibacterium neoaurum]KJQ48529.1 hypothetical protein TS71_20680 [Mycolicibacterium neoaurum]KUM06915.1 hypothetical protein AVZ31_18850 [Mycolicibacterium neoaurum]
MPVLDLDDGDWVEGSYGVLRVDGLYAALLARERDRARPDPREMRRLHPEGGYCTLADTVCKHEPIPLSRSPLLDALEAGRPAVLEGRQLRGRSLPEVTLRREQALDWF